MDLAQALRQLTASDLSECMVSEKTRVRATGFYSVEARCTPEAVAAWIAAELHTNAYAAVAHVCGTEAGARACAALVRKCLARLGARLVNEEYNDWDAVWVDHEATNRIASALFICTETPPRDEALVHVRTNAIITYFDGPGEFGNERNTAQNRTGAQFSLRMPVFEIKSPQMPGRVRGGTLV